MRAPVEFVAPEPNASAADRKMLAVTPETHDTVRELADKHNISMTKMITAIVRYHVLYSEK